PPSRRVLVLETLAETSIATAPPVLLTALDQALQGKAPKEVRAQAVRTAAVLQWPQLDATLTKLVEQPEAPAELRLEALRAVILRRPHLDKAIFEFLLNVLKDEEQPLLRLAAGEITGRSELSDHQIGQVVEVLGSDILISPSVVLPALLPQKSK